MIVSFLDNDLYKFAMQQAVLARYPEKQAAYAYINRNIGLEYPEAFVEAVREDLAATASISMTGEEREWLADEQQFAPSYLEYLDGFRYNPDQVTIRHGSDGSFSLRIEGGWVETILWEVPLLTILTRRYYEFIETNWDREYELYYERSLEKASALAEAGCVFSDFGTRRRREVAYQELALKAFKLTEAQSEDRHFFSGTSNLHFARTLGLPAVGTLGHEWVMAHSVLAGLQLANRAALETWWDIHGDRYAEALTDTFTLDLFFLNFSTRLARNYRVVRHDSGDPFEFVDLFIRFYHECGIDPAEKTLCFSDSLNVRQARRIEQYVGGRTRTAYEIGAFLTNDFPRQKPPSMVVKLVELDGQPVVKTTSDQDKSVGDPAVLEQVRSEIQGIRRRMDDSKNPFEDFKLQG